MYLISHSQKQMLKWLHFKLRFRWSSDSIVCLCRAFHIRFSPSSTSLYSYLLSISFRCFCF